MRPNQPGTCALCGRTCAKGSMSRHLTACLPAHDPKRGVPVPLIRLRIEGLEMPMFWLDVEVKATAPLRALDHFLRDIWLECCGHLSSFEIGDVSYQEPPEYDDIFYEARPLTIQMGRVIPVPPAKFHHEYDFGSTTVLELRAISIRKASAGSAAVRLLARNDPPDWRCQVCGRPAVELCCECIWNDANPFFCRKHLNSHGCKEKLSLPVVNSPRMGVCGYTG